MILMERLHAQSHAATGRPSAGYISSLSEHVGQEGTGGGEEKSIRSHSYVAETHSAPRELILDDPQLAHPCCLTCSQSHHHYPCCLACCLAVGAALGQFFKCSLSGDTLLPEK